MFTYEMGFRFELGRTSVETVYMKRVSVFIRKFIYANPRGVFSYPPGLFVTSFLMIPEGDISLPRDYSSLRSS